VSTLFCRNFVVLIQQNILTTKYHMNKKLGYYTCNGIEFQSKIRAAIYSEATRKPLEWKFNNAEFSTFPWHIDPEIPLSKLYDLRAKQIREEFDYVVICYTGGSDSNNMVESFIRQGLHIDEIVSNYPVKISERFLSSNNKDNSSSNTINEFKFHAADRLNYIQNKCPKTKIKMLDTSELLVEALITTKDKYWVLNRNEVLNPGGTNQFNYTYFNELRKQFDKDKKIAMLMGIDKPRCQIIGDEFYLYFSDKVANIVNVTDHLNEYPNATPVYFYWDPDNMLAMAKQAHTLLKWLRANPQYQKYWRVRDFGILREIQEPLLKTILYPDTWNMSWWQAKKASKDWYCEIDSWFYQGYRDTKEFEIWKSGIDYISNKIPSFLSHDSVGNPSGTLVIHSPNYFIGKLSD
jgi:hypothetical protein